VQNVGDEKGGNACVGPFGFAFGLIFG